MTDRNADVKVVDALLSLNAAKLVTANVVVAAVVVLAIVAEYAR